MRLLCDFDVFVFCHYNNVVNGIFWPTKCYLFGNCDALLSYSIDFLRNQNCLRPLSEISGNRMSGESRNLTVSGISDTLEFISDTLESISDTLEFISDTLEFITAALEFITAALEFISGVFRVISGNASGERCKVVRLSSSDGQKRALGDIAASIPRDKVGADA